MSLFLIIPNWNCYLNCDYFSGYINAMLWTYSREYQKNKDLLSYKNLFTLYPLLWYPNSDTGVFCKGFTAMTDTTLCPFFSTWVFLPFRILLLWSNSSVILRIYISQYQVVQISCIYLWSSAHAGRTNGLPFCVVPFSLFILSYPLLCRLPDGKLPPKKHCRESVNILKLPLQSEELTSLQAKNPKKENERFIWL